MFLRDENGLEIGIEEADKELNYIDKISMRGIGYSWIQTINFSKNSTTMVQTYE